MDNFETIYKRLNAEQKQAVDLIDGPLLVIAGPGTGKTQLLSARVANILRQTDTLAQNILCLTFTESGARAMRERLAGMIGPDSYDVHISTYHGFGSDIIRSYPEFFTGRDVESDEDSRLEKPIDDLTKTQILEAIVRALPYDDPMRSAQYYVKSLVATIGELKKSLVGPARLREIASNNKLQIAALSPKIQKILGPMPRMPRVAEAMPLFSDVLECLHQFEDGLAELAADELESALAEASESNKTNTITAWKNDWLHRSEDGDWEFTDPETSDRMIALAGVYEKYESALRSRSLYDFDDMILRSIDALKTYPELLFNLQEKYQYVLLDEFQDTNAAQFKLVELLASHPVHEGRPNIMAVGDDDQAIYAFQGADIGNMMKFTEIFKDVSVINLTQNYRSHQDVISTAHAVAEQIDSRLHHRLPGIIKTLVAASTALPKDAVIERVEFNSQASEYAWIGERIKTLISSGVSPSEIAVLSPKHARLETLVPFLNKQGIPVSYEKRENILDTKLVQSLELMSRLCLAINQQQTPLVNQLIPRVLSLDFWEIATEDIWRANWQCSKYGEERSWIEIALENPHLRSPCLFFLKLGMLSSALPLEYALDFLTGVQEIEVAPDELYAMPLHRYYFNPAHKQANPLRYYEAVSHLSVIRSKLRDYQSGEEDILKLNDFIRFIDMYRAAEQPLINSHPIAQAEASVQLMTAYKSKGLEFDYVFLLSVHDDIWGKKARGNNNKIGLPSNLRYIRYFGSGEDELRRLLFVAITRAKHGLILTSHTVSDGGKATEPVKYLLESGDGDTHISEALPAAHRQVMRNQQQAISAEEAVEVLWQQRHTMLTPTLKSLLGERLETYRMAPTHLNTFIDLEHGGPDQFLLRNLLKFPQAPEPDGEFGNAVHHTLDWAQKQYANNKPPTSAAILKQFDTDLAGRYIARELMDEYRARGHRALEAYIAERAAMLKGAAVSEADFIKEGVVIGDTAVVTGKIDRLEIDTAAKTIRVVDFKTGRPAAAWDKSIKLLKYRQQLYFYKLLVEGSHTYKGYKVLDGRLEFVEPNSKGKILPPLTVTYNDAETQEFEKLIVAVWNRIQAVELPDIAAYKPNYYETLKFIKDLLA